MNDLEHILMFQIKKANFYMDLARILKKRTFLAAVRTAKEYVLSGDVVQVVISQRFEAETSAHPFDIYRALRIINPSPYMFT